ncbi:ADP-ribosyl cyclase/cyclic ADP-ribose hydrolase 1 isoform X2 [Chelonoidis abingdonii]|uniref:ADP-ribosyl cyclase/cyclic ADP-ribose hydrolase 1 isoform X2 n=1 Tax=Chelonoidis abingdonii TaxID=106734 RepID=UPI0013F1E3A8|nr:ADP-ribosyl cyclase/cyclic ADP-ribose hydrolase 1 [Chelonoidis abingdonii]
MSLQNRSSKTRQRTILLVIIMVLIVTIVAVLAAVLLANGTKETSMQLLQWKGRGTTKNLQEVILGRCYNYITTVNPELRDKDCQNIWETMQKAFIYKNPCNITTEDYQPLLDLASHPIPCNKSLFWSKTSDLVHRYTKTNHHFLTLEDTLLGYMADGVSWCGNPSSPGINYESCPKWSECESNPSSVYWKMASKMFAEAACGVVQVMLNGSIEAGAFRSNSESCTGRSITRLKSILEERNLRVSCEDNYRPVQLLQCASDPDHADCRLCTNNVQ